MNSFLPALLLILFLVGCSKSNDEKPSVQPPIENKMLDDIETAFGINIPEKDKLTYISAFPLNGVLTLNVSNENTPIALVYNIESKKLISKLTFNRDKIKANLGWGEEKEVEFSHLILYSKTGSHLYGATIYSPGNHYAYFVSEIASNKVVEHDPLKSMSSPGAFGLRFYNWFDGMVLCTNGRKYSVIGDDNKIIIEGERSSHIVAPTGTPVSLTQTIVFTKVNFQKDYGFQVHSLIDNRYAEIICNPGDKPNDLAEVKSVTSDGKIAVVIFKVTSFEGEVSENSLKVDLTDLKIIE